MLDRKAIGEKIVVGVVSAVALSALALFWNWASHGGLIRALGGLTSTAPIPSGVVLAYVGTEEKPCPDSTWSLYGDAKGKVIVGAGQGSVKVGDTGGSETREYNYDNINVPGSDIGGLAMVLRGVDRDTRGPGWQAYTNMPPYIALYFCKKD